MLPELEPDLGDYLLAEVYDDEVEEESDDEHDYELYYVSGDSGW